MDTVTPEDRIIIEKYFSFLSTPGGISLINAVWKNNPVLIAEIRAQLKKGERPNLNLHFLEPFLTAYSAKYGNLPTTAAEVAELRRVLTIPEIQKEISDRVYNNPMVVLMMKTLWIS